MMVVSTVLLLCSVLHVLHFGYSSAIEDVSKSHTDPEYLKELLRSGRYEEFTRLVQNGNVDLEKSKENRDFDDEMLESGKIEEERQSINFVNKPSKKWEHHVVPYIILPEGYSETDIEILEKAINSFNNQVKNIQYRKKTSEEDYVVFSAGDDGCYSNIGRVGGENRIYLEPPSCLKEGIILHEMIHTLGFTHEQNRPDRDQYIEILYENIPEAWHGNYRKVSPDDYSSLGNYDYYSLMHYRMRAPGTGKPAFRIIQDGVSTSGIGQRLAMTKDDVEKIEELYS